jgi:polyphosphate kinase
MNDINKMFRYLENWKAGPLLLKSCKTLMVCPTNMRNELYALIDTEIRNAKAGKAAGIILKVNSLSDASLIDKLYAAGAAGVKIEMIVRGIFCAEIDRKKFKQPVKAISIVDEYLEHSRVMIFHNQGKEKVYISSADWMVRNLNHRVEAAVPITDPIIKQELIDIIHIQLRDNVKARILNSELANNYVPFVGKKKIRSQIETYHYLFRKNNTTSEASSN